MNISRGAYNILFFSLYLKVKIFFKIFCRLREYVVAIVSFSLVCCQQCGGRKNLTNPKGIMSCFS
jgi:hypothetical protein